MRSVLLQAVFIHYVGDMISSLIVLAMGLVIEFVPAGTWIDYVDPGTSLIIVAIILWTTFPLGKRQSSDVLLFSSLSIHLSIYLSACLSVYVSIYILSICVCMHL